MEAFQGPGQPKSLLQIVLQWNLQSQPESENSEVVQSPRLSLSNPQAASEGQAGGHQCDIRVLGDRVHLCVISISAGIVGRCLENGAL